MKMNKKKLAVVSLVLCIAAIISMSSLAWFTATDYVDNTLNFAEKSSFVVDVIEHDADGNEVGTLDDPIGNTYEDLLPNQVISKDPCIINKSATEAQFIRATVTLSNAAKWKTLVAEGTDLATIFEGFDDEAWTRYDAPVVSGDTISYTFYLDEQLPAGEDACLFTGVRIPSTITTDDVADLQETTITITADAIQTTGFSEAATAYTAFNTSEAVKETTATN